MSLEQVKVSKFNLVYRMILMCISAQHAIEADVFMVT